MPDLYIIIVHILQYTCLITTCILNAGLTGQNVFYNGQNVPYNGQNVPYKKRNSYSPKEFQTPKEYLKNIYKDI